MCIHKYIHTYIDICLHQPIVFVCCYKLNVSWRTLQLQTSLSSRRYQRLHHSVCWSHMVTWQELLLRRRLTRRLWSGSSDQRHCLMHFRIALMCRPTLTLYHRCVSVLLFLKSCTTGCCVNKHATHCTAGCRTIGAANRLYCHLYSLLYYNQLYCTNITKSCHVRLCYMDTGIGKSLTAFFVIG